MGDNSHTTDGLTSRCVAEAADLGLSCSDFSISSRKLMMLWSLASESRAPSSGTPGGWFSFPNFSKLSAVRELELGSCWEFTMVNKHPGKGSGEEVLACLHHCTPVTSLILWAKPCPTTSLCMGCLGKHPSPQCTKQFLYHLHTPPSPPPNSSIAPSKLLHHLPWQCPAVSHQAAITVQGWTQQSHSPAHPVRPGISVLLEKLGWGQQLRLLLQQPERVQQLVECDLGWSPAASNHCCLQVLVTRLPGAHILREMRE